MASSRGVSHAKHKRFPTVKRKPGERGNVCVDIEKVKEMYLSGSHYRWSDFCVANGFNPYSNANDWFKSSVDWEQWKREWTRRKNIVLEEEVTPKMIDCRKLITEQRLRFVQDWSSIAKNMKALLTHLMNEHVISAAEDQKNFATIRIGVSQKKLKMSIDDLSSFAAAGNRIAELEARALMIVAGDKNRVKDQLEHAANEAVASDKPVEFEFQTIGTSMSASDRTRMLAEYFDQFQAPEKAPIPVEAKVEPSEDQG